MVGIFSRFSGYMRPHYSYTQDRKDGEMSERGGAGETHVHGDDTSQEGDGVLDFKPVDHPLEPLDEDHPAICPFPHSLLLNDGGTWKEPLAVRLLKGAESLVIANEESTVEHPLIIRTDRKRHHHPDPPRDPGVSPITQGYNVEYLSSVSTI